MVHSSRVPVMFLALILAHAVSGQQASAPGDSKPSTWGSIDRQRLLDADSHPEDWLTAGRDFGKSHFSPLARINRDTIGALGFAWDYRTGTNRGLESTPIVVDGVLFTSGQSGAVYALDAGSGKEIWKFDPAIDGQVNRIACCDAVNRGVAVWRGNVYVAALDGRLFALDAATGSVLWQTDTVIDRSRGYTSTGAPEIAGNVVVIGNAGAEFDARGYISAYDLDTGQFAWRFFVVPGDPRKGFEHPELELAATTWDPDSRWEVGLGGTPWDGMVYDPELNLLYVGTGNAALYNPRERSPAGGDNLFLSSILAIDPSTGRMVWYYQEVPGDQWDYTATAPMILTELAIGGERRKVLLHAPKNGFFYVIDRQTGKVLSARNIVPINWASHIDLVSGRPAINKDLVDWTTGIKLVFPSTGGAHSWSPMAYSPEAGLVYIPVMELGSYLFDPTSGHEYKPGLRNSGATSLLATGGTAVFGARSLPAEVQAVVDSGALLRGAPDPTPRGFLRAWDPVNQKLAWQVESAGWWDRAGVLATAGGLVIQGTATGYLRAYDAASGEMLKEIDVGSSIVSAPMTYAIDGEQFIAVMAGIGGGPLAFSPPPESAAYQYGNAGRILAFRLGGGATPKPAPLPAIEPLPQPPLLNATPQQLARGAVLFEANCAICHKNSNGRGASPDLRRMSPAMHQNFNRIVLAGLLRPRGMPQWDDVLSEDDTDALHAYLISTAWAAYRAEREPAR